MHSFSPNSVPTESNGTDTSTVQAIPRSGEVPLSINRLKIMNSPTLADVSHSPVNSHLSNYHQTSVIILFSILAAFVLCSLLALLAWKRIRKRSRKLQELNYLTSSCGSSLSSSAHFALGIKPDQSIEFVVPTITLPETTPYSMTEDSFTDSDYYPYNSPTDRDYYGGRGQRKRHLTGHSTYLSVSDVGRAYCGPQNEPETAGKVNFVLHYSIHRQQLLVTLLSASDLPASERKGSINPFAKIVLLPEKSPKFHTKVHRNNRNPVFNEMFIFPARKETLDERRLRISIWDSDRFNRKFFVGQVVYNLAESGITSYISSDVITDEILCPLSPHKSNSSTGELSVAVLFKPEIATLTVTINKARGLMVKDISTVYIKVSLYVSKKKVGSKKSPIRKAHTTVDFNDSFHVHVKDSAIENVNVVVNLIGRSSLGLNAKHNLGKVYIGSCCYSSDGSNQWVEMLKEKGRPIVKWHALC